uniref:Uncharacterized protein n=1 Tax=Setaria digitata TaxID=48799 RepID=A0A915PMJ0_9BILA
MEKAQPTLPTCATSTTPTAQMHNDKVIPKQLSVVALPKIAAQMIPQQAENKNKSAKFEINRTQSETEVENVSLVASIRIDKTQGSISQRVDDSADTGEYVDDLPEDRQRSSASE